MDFVDALFVAAVITFTLTAAVIDYRYRRIPNWLTVASFVVALVYHTVVSGFSGVGFALAGFAAGFGMLFILWVIGGGGGGDVKLMAALGAWLGAKHIVVVFLLSAGCALVATLFLAMIHAVVLGVSRSHSVAAAGLSANSSKNSEASIRPAAKFGGWALPYALPVLVGTWGLLAWQLLCHQ